MWTLGIKSVSLTTTDFNALLDPDCWMTDNVVDVAVQMACAAQVGRTAMVDYGALSPVAQSPKTLLEALRGNTAGHRACIRAGRALCGRSPRQGSEKTAVARLRQGHFVLIEAEVTAGAWRARHWNSYGTQRGDNEYWASEASAVARRMVSRGPCKWSARAGNHKGHAQERAQECMSAVETWALWPSIAQARQEDSVSCGMHAISMAVHLNKHLMALS
jgi:hypothetical protein